MRNPRRKIVVVEDDPGMCRSLKRLLEANGYETETFGSAELALESTAAADCFVLDINLPGISGLEMQTEIVRRGGDVHVVFITADDRPTFRERARAFGASYLVKPFRGAALLDAVNSVCGQASLPGGGEARVT